jgi:hypothetical protein
MGSSAPTGDGMAENNQYQKIISLLETAHMLADDLQEGTLSYLIERAIDEARAASLFPPNLKQAPYFPG